MSFLRVKASLYFYLYTKWGQIGSRYHVHVFYSLCYFFFFFGEQCCILGQIYGNVTSWWQSSGNCRLDFQTQIRTGGQRTSFYFSFAVRKEITLQSFKNSFNRMLVHKPQSPGYNKCVHVSEEPKLCLPKGKKNLRMLFKSLFGNH